MRRAWRPYRSTSPQALPPIRRGSSSRRVHLPREHEIESLFAVANGYLGTRGALDEGSTISAPATVLAGVFGLLDPQGGVPEFVPVPDWTRLRLAMNGDHLTLEGPGTLDHRRVLDLYQGILWREWRCDSAGRITRLRFLRLASLADRHTLVQSVTLTAENYSSPVRLRAASNKLPVCRSLCSQPCGSTRPSPQVPCGSICAPRAGIQPLPWQRSALYTGTARRSRRRSSRRGLGPSVHFRGGNRAGLASGSAGLCVHLA